MDKNNIVRSVPILQTKDAHALCDFYCKVFGFSKDWEHQYEPGFPWFISISSGSVSFFLTEHVNESAFGSCTYLNVNDVDELASHIESCNIAIEVGPQNTPYGMRELVVRDPDGNSIRVGQPME